MLAILLLFILAGPLFETVDHWDNFPQTGNDTVLSLVMLVTCVGAVSLFKKCAAAVLELIAHIKLSERLSEDLSALDSLMEPVPIESPPLALLTALRI